MPRRAGLVFRQLAEQVHIVKIQGAEARDFFDLTEAALKPVPLKRGLWWLINYRFFAQPALENALDDVVISPLPILLWNHLHLDFISILNFWLLPQIEKPPHSNTMPYGGITPLSTVCYVAAQTLNLVPDFVPAATLS